MATTCLVLASLATSVTSVSAQTTFEVSISINEDDAHEDSGGSVKQNDDIIELGKMDWVGVRFQGVTIPQGATITNAYVEFTAEADQTDPTHVTIFGEDTDDANTFTGSDYNISTRTRTAAAVGWPNMPGWSTNGKYQTPDIKSVIEEIVARSGWVSGNDLVILLRSDDDNGLRVAWARDGNSSNAPLIHIEYTTGPSDYYVRTDGNDSNSGTGTTAAEAWATIAFAATQSLPAGSTVYVQAGTYAGTVAPTVDGTSADPIQFIADTTGSISSWSSGAVVLQASSGNNVLDLTSDDYLEFYGFTLDGETASDAISVDFGQGIVIKNCEIYGGADGIEIDSSATATLINCLIHSNSGDGVHLQSGTATLWNCTIADNGNDGIQQDGGTLTITNSIVANNTDDGLDSNIGTMTHTYNLVYGSGDLDYEGTSASTGEISVDPLFVSAGDYHLTTNSPAIDAATNAAGTVDDDLDGTARPLSSGWDIGCYEGDGLVGHWTFDEGSGTTIADSSSFANDASFNTGTPTWIGGVRGGALEFDGTNDAITGATLDPPVRGTVAFWFRSDGPPLARQRLWGVGADYEMWQDPDGLVSIDVSTDGFQGGFITTTPLYEAGHWYHLTAIYNSDDDSYQIYINGQLHKSGVSTWAMVPQPSALLSFGTRTGSTERFSGALDDFRIYSRQLTATEVAELYGLVGHWPMDEAVGTTAADNTAFSNDATLSGATWTTDCNGIAGLEFDGTGDTAATNSNFVPPDAGTVAFWMRGANTPAARGRLFGINGDWEARQETDGSVSFDLGASPFVGNEPFATPAVDNENRWYHIVASFDASDDSYSVYVDGVLEASGISPVDLVTQPEGILTFGSRTGSTEYWEGAMRDFRVYNRPLLDLEITGLSGVIARWKLDETSGIVAVDASTAGNDATYVGSPTLGVAGAFPTKTGTGVELDGTSQSITSGASLLNDLQQFTIAGWVRPNSTVPDRSFFGQYDLIELGVDFAANQIDLWTNSGGFINATAYLPPGKWSHVAAVGDGAELKLYVDGVQVASGGSATVDYGNNTEIFKIGEGVLATTGDFYDGRVDDVQVFSRALCPDDVRSLYKGGRPAGVRILQWLETR